MGRRQIAVKAPNALAAAVICGALFTGACDRGTNISARPTCHVNPGAPRRRLVLSHVGPQPRLAAAAGDVIDATARWSANLAAPHAFPSGDVCEFDERSGKTASADFVLLLPGRLTISTSDAVATDAMDPAFFGHVTIRN